MNFIVCIFLAVQPRLLLGREDYWDDNFDEGKNCEAEEEIKKLKRLPANSARCAVTKHGKNFTRTGIGDHYDYDYDYTLYSIHHKS